MNDWLTVSNTVTAMFTIIVLSVMFCCDWSLELTLPILRRTIMLMKRGLDIGAQYGKTEEFDEPIDSVLHR
jgi:hypothetical protein